MLLSAPRTLAIAAVLALGGCADRPPVSLSSQFTPPTQTARTERRPDAEVCRVYLGDILDTREDPGAMGEIGGRQVQATDPVSWIRSGVFSLERDPGIVFTDSASGADLGLRVELVKAYTMSITSEKSTNVVLRVQYRSSGDQPTVRVYRGADTSMNWAGGEDETQSAFNAALAQLLDVLHSDLVTRCHKHAGA